MRPHYASALAFWASLWIVAPALASMEYVAAIHVVPGTDAQAEAARGTDAAYGVGARFSLFSAEVRAEYEYFDVEDIDVSLVSVGVVWSF